MILYSNGIAWVSIFLPSLDFTKSNEWTGKSSFGNRCLHSLGSDPNPYEQAISIVGRSVFQVILSLYQIVWRIQLSDV